MTTVMNKNKWPNKPMVKAMQKVFNPIKGKKRTRKGK